MTEDPSEVIEWHIFGSPPAKSSQSIHVGPFATEEECRAVLAGLRQLPWFNHGPLEVHKKCRRREKRIRVKLPVQVRRLASTEKTWPAHTVDISTLGARLAKFEESLKLGEIVEIGCGNREAVFRVVWVGLLGTRTEGHTGLECLSPETNIWDLDLSTRTDDEPLLQEIAIARAVQRNLLPRQKPVLRTLDYEGDCIQARTVGGDYYDFIDMGPGRVGLVLADVAGKGVAAALLMANLQGSIHVAGSGHRNLPGLLSSVNDHLYKYTDPDRYATLFYGCYDDETRILSYVNCGHSPPLLLRGCGTVERLVPTATVLGLFGHWECSLAEIRLQAGDVLSIFTDGITETTGTNAEEFGESRLLEVLKRSRHLEAAAILRNVEQAAEQFSESDHLQDDFTLVVARAR